MLLFRALRSLLGLTCVKTYLYFLRVRQQVFLLLTNVYKCVIKMHIWCCVVEDRAPRCHLLRMIFLLENFHGVIRLYPFTHFNPFIPPLIPPAQLIPALEKLR